MKQSRTRFLYWVCLIALMTFFLKNHKAYGANAVVDTNLTIVMREDGSEMYDIYVEQGNLIIRAKYFHNSRATLSYHTEYLYFTAADTNGKPLSGGKYYSFDVPTQRSLIDSGVYNESYEVFSVPAAMIREWAQSLTGLSANGNRLTVYLSHGFVLKKRNNEQGQWKYEKSPVYHTLEGIRRAAAWSYETYENFSSYFDVPLVLDLTTYKLEVVGTEGGITYNSANNVEAGEKVFPLAVANKGYFFKGWEIKEGIINEEIDLGNASLCFSMPSSNMRLKAYFEKEPEVRPTREPIQESKPTPTPPPEEPDVPTVSPSPVSTPMPTPLPPYFPIDDEKLYKRHIRYYTTDCGYTMQKIYEDNGKLANLSGEEAGGTMKSNRYMQLGESYSIGLDLQGNEWYFIPGDDATARYVHPKQYKGYEVNSTQVCNITELTFPDSIVSKGKEYSVVHIGGGTKQFGERKYSTGGTEPERWDLYAEKGYYIYNTSYSYQEQAGYLHTQLYETKMQYAFGIAGNGYITSVGQRLFLWSRSGEEREERKEYQNDYYVHNTTLKYITIPDSVTEIGDYAFWGCQALVKISGGRNVAVIGESAFMGSNHLIPKLCKKEGNNSFTYHYYNGFYSFDEKSKEMSQWQEQVAYSDYLELSEFPGVTEIKQAAFMWHCNLYDVCLTDRVAIIGPNAYAGCKLNSIVVPGENTRISEGVNYSDFDGNSYNMGGGGTLGASGSGETVIITIPESSAMLYGLKYDEYYQIRCGYEVIYSNNILPEEIYPSVSKLRKIEEEAVQCVALGAVEIMLDRNGKLYLYKKDRSPIAMKVAGDIEFQKIIVLDGTHWDGSANVPCKRYFAVGKKGEIWGCSECAPEVWNDMGVPEGSGTFQWSGNGGVVWLYYLNKDGYLCCTGIKEKSGVYGGGVEAAKHETIYRDYPDSTWYTYQAFVIENEGMMYPGAVEGIDYEGKYYEDGTPPQIVACTRDGKLVRFAAYPLRNSYATVTESYVMPEIVDTECNGTVWIYKENSNSVGDGRLYTSSGYDIYYIKKSGELFRANYSGGQFSSVLVVGGGFSGTLPVIKRSFSILHGQQGTFVLNQKKRLAERLVQSSGIEEAWTVEYEFYNSDYGSSEYGSFLYFLDEKGGFRCAYDFSGQYANRWGVRTLVSNVKKVVHGGRGILILDGEGCVWSVGVNEYGALASHETYIVKGKEASSYFYTARKVSSNREFTDIYFEDSQGVPRYSLVTDEEGKVYGAGCDNRIFGDFEPHYSGFMEVSVPLEMGESQKKSILVGYDFFERLYGCMFKRQGYEFRCWNTSADGTGREFRPGQEIVMEAPLLLYAQWEEERRVIQYAPNGGEGHMEPDILEKGKERIRLKGNTFSKSGYEFIEWNTEPDGTGVAYKDQEIITVGIGVTVLYAQWKPFSYVVKIAEDDIRVRPVVILESFEMEYDREWCAPGVLEDKVYRIEYDLNRRKYMSTIPVWKTEIPLAGEYTRAAMAFMGWNLYEEWNGEYSYIGFFEAGERIMNPARQKGKELVLFPVWGGEASYVKLPTAECTGYDFIGWTSNKTEEKEENVIRSEEGSGAKYKPLGNQQLYGFYLPKEYEIHLLIQEMESGETDIVQNQKEVTVTFDCKVPDILVPESNCYVFQGYFTEPGGNGIQYYDENGRGLRLWNVADGSVSVLYAYLIPETEVTLDGRGATKQEQKSVKMTYGQKGPKVIVPEKTGYRFLGYYTETRGDGTKYFDEFGDGMKEWEEKKIVTLYAYWVQNPVELPEEEEFQIPEEPESEQIELYAALDNVTVQVYSDDGNPETYGRDDTLPYQVSDVWEEGQIREGAIPSTEKIVIQGNVGAWMLSTVLQRRSGTEYVRVKVTVPYRTQTEDAQSEELLISPIRTYRKEVWIPKVWSYWEISKGGIYLPESVKVSNECIFGKEVYVPVSWEAADAAQKPSYHMNKYGEKKNHISWPYYEEDEIPCLDITLEEQYIISECPGEEPDVEGYLEVICQNAARKDKTQFWVFSDFLEVDGITMLSDVPGKEGCGEIPEREAVTLLEKRITETSDMQIYKDGIALEHTAKNGRYETTAEVIYKKEEAPEEFQDERKIEVSEVNEIKIHTPVICSAKIEAKHEEQYQCGKIPDGCAVLVLDTKEHFSDFYLQIENTGYHSDKQGYGEANYERFLLRKDGKVQNQVCFPFCVFVDAGNDSANENDILLQKDTWYTVGTEKQRFYVPFWVETGEYEIQLRAIAANGENNTEKAEVKRNKDSGNYVAEDTVKVYLTGRLYGFEVYKVTGTLSWEITGEQKYTVGVKPEAKRGVWETLPLRTGVHPYYRNIGGLNEGEGFSFSFMTVGYSGKRAPLVRIRPLLVLVTDNGYEEVDVYFEQEKNGRFFLRQWGNDEMFFLEEEMNSHSDPGTEKLFGDTKAQSEALECFGEEIYEAVRRWCGTYTLPNKIYVAQSGSDVMDYQDRYGLSFNEDFWIKEEKLMLLFEICLEDDKGELLYYGKLSEGITNNIWQTEAGKEVRKDSGDTEYFISGGEVAVIYLKEKNEKSDATHGIY